MKICSCELFFTYGICNHCNMGVTKPPHNMTVTNTITMVADNINLLASDDVSLIAKAYAMAPLRPKTQYVT